MGAPDLKDILIHHWQYQKWADTLILDALAQLPEEELNRNRGASHKSLRETLNHVFLADQIWYARLTGLGNMTMAEISIPPNLEAMRKAWLPLLDRYLVLIRNFEDLGKVIHFQRDGKSHSNPAWQTFLHVVNHDTLHRGQIMGMLRQMGIAPPSTDLIGYYRQLASAATV